MSLSTEKKTIITNSLDRILSLIPARSKDRAAIEQEVKTIKQAATSSGWTEDVRLMHGLRISQAFANKREGEVFLLEHREQGGDLIVGWSELIERLGLREGSIRMSLSIGKGTFTRMIDDELWTITRTNRQATDNEIADYEASKARRAERLGLKAQPKKRR